MKLTPLVVLGTVIFIAQTDLSRAASQTWTGAGQDNFWGTGANWLGGATPSPGDLLLFGGTIRNGSTNNFVSGTSFGGITFNEPSGPFVLGGNPVSLSANITNNQVVTVETISLPLSLAATPVVDVVTNGVLTLGGVVSGSGGLTKVDGGQLNLAAANTFTGPLSILGGTVMATADANLGAVPGSATPADIILNGGTLQSSTSFTLNPNRGIGLGSATGGIGAIKVNPGMTVTYGGIIANNGGAGGLAKSSFGGLTLFGANTYTGPTIIENGALTLSYASAGAPVNNIISSSSSLTVGGQTAGVGQTNYAALIMNGNAGAANTQAFNGTLIDVGGQFVQVTNGAGGTANLALGALTHNVGGTVVFIPPSAGNGNITTTSGNNNGIIGGWATIGNGANQNGVNMGTNFACVDTSGNLINFTNYLLYSGGDLEGQVSDVTNLLFNPPAGVSEVMTVNTDNAGTTTDVNAIKQLTTNTYSGIYIGPGNTLRLGQYGGILAQETGQAPVITLGGVNNSVQTGNGTSGAQDIGILTAGGAHNAPGEIDLTINNNNETSGSYIIESTITDNGSGSVSFVKSGPGPMKLDGHNTFSGGLYILQGRLQFAGTEIGTGNPGAGGTGPIYVYPGAEFFPSGVGTIPITNDLYIAGNGVSDGVGAIRLTGVFSNGIITMIGDSRLGGGTATVPIYDQITGPFNLDIGASGNSGGSGFNNGCLLYNTANNWSGNTTIVGRTGTAGNTLLRNGASNVIPDGFGMGNMQFGNSGNTVSVTAWDLNGFNETINGLVSIGTIPSLMYISNNTANATSVLTLGNNDQSGNFSGSIVGNLALTKIGAGEQTLSGANTYTGNTTVNAGTLAVSGVGTLAGGGTITVNSGGTLDISGVTAGFSTANPLTLSGGTLTGNGTVGNLNMANGALTLALNATTPANLVSGTLTTGGSTNYINVSSVSGISGYPALFTLIQYSGALGGAGNNFGLGQVPNANTIGYVTNDTAHSRIELVLLNGPKILTWAGTDPVNPTFWDLSTVNWLAFKGTPNQIPSAFNTADSTFFDDTASSTNVDITETLEPGVLSINNSALNYAFTGSGSLIGPMTLSKSGSGSLTLLNTGGDGYTGGVTVNGGTVTFGANNSISGGLTIAGGATVQVGTNGGTGNLPSGNVADAGSLVFDRGANLSVANVISGTGSLTKIDTNLLALNGANLTFTGAVSVVAGTLQAGSASAMGTADGNTTIGSGATLDVNAQTLNTEPVIVSGTGIGGNGAIINSSTTAAETAMGNVTLAGDTTFGGVGRWDIRGGTATLSTSGNPYTLNKVGTNYIAIVSVSVDGALGDINVLSGLLSFESGTTGMGDSSHTLTVSSGATLQLYGTTATFVKQLVLNGNGAATTLNCGNGNGNIFAGPITLNGNCIFGTASGTALVLSGGMTGNGSFIQTGVGTNTIGGSASYTGGTTVSNGTLLVDGALSGSVTVKPAAVFGGTGTASGTVTALAGGIISPGDIASSPVATFNVNNLAISNSVIALDLSASTGSGNDLLNVTGALSLSGTNNLRVNPLSFMNVGDQYTLVQYAGAPLASTATNSFVVTSTRSGFTFRIIDPSTTPGVIKIQVLSALGNDFWTGQASSTWDTSTINWKRNGNPVAFNANDYAYFDDTSAVTNVNLSGILSQSGITVSSTTEAYQFGGTGGLSGSGGLLLSGAGLTITNLGSNTYTGPITISSGTLQVGAGGVGGSLGSGVMTNNGSLVFDLNTNLSVPNSITGSGTLTTLGTGIISLGGANSFAGQVTVTQGTLRALTSTALGNALSSQTLVNNGATLDITNTANLSAYTITVSGAGVGGNGAIVNNSGSTTFVGQNIAQVTLTGDTTIGGSGRLDFRASSATSVNALLLGGYNLTKVGTNLLQLAGVQIDPSLGNINVQAGTFGIQWGMPEGLGNSGAMLTVSSNATFAFFTVSNAVSKVLVLNPGAIVAGQQGSNVFSGPVTLNGSNIFNITSGQLELTAPVGGPGSLAQIGVGSLILSASAETYTGNTYVSGGTLVLSDVATIDNTTNIILSAGTIDASAHNDDTLTLGVAGGQTLAGGGTVIGNLVENPGSSINPGNGVAPATLNIVNGVATLGGAVIMDLNRTNAQTADKFVAISVSASGMLTVINLGPDLLTSNRFQLFSIPVSGFATVNLPLQNATHTVNYVWQNNLGVDGSILLTQGASSVNTNPTNIVARVSAGSLNLSWPSDHTGWLLQVQTNSLTRGLTSSNWFAVPGSTNVDQISIPINPANGAVFYRLVYP